MHNEQVTEECIFSSTDESQRTGAAVSAQMEALDSRLQYIENNIKLLVQSRKQEKKVVSCICIRLID